MTTNPLFEKMMLRIRKSEAGYTDDPRDNGNWTGGVRGSGKLLGTKYGIAANTYPDEDIKNLTWERALYLYKRDFWDVIRADQFKPAIAFQFLDAAVNSGPRRAKEWLQAAAKVPVDGDIGPRTMAAIAAADHNDIAVRFLASRIRFMSSLASWVTYGKGWARRIADCLDYVAEDN